MPSNKPGGSHHHGHGRHAHAGIYGGIQPHASPAAHPGPPQVMPEGSYQVGGHMHSSATNPVMLAMSVNSNMFPEGLTSPSTSFITSSEPQYTQFALTASQIPTATVTAEQLSSLYEWGVVQGPTGAFVAHSSVPHYSQPTLSADAALYGPGPPIVMGDNVRGPEGCNLFIFHLPNEMTNWDLYNLFKRFGSILSVHIMINKQTGLSRGFGFVSYQNRADAENAIRAMNGFRIGNKRLKVQPKRKNTKGPQLESHSEFSTDGRTSVDGNQSDTEGEDGNTHIHDSDEQQSVSGSYPTSPTAALPVKSDTKEFYEGSPAKPKATTAKLEDDEPAKAFDVLTASPAAADT